MRKSFSPHQQNKNFLCLCNKNFLMETCRNIYTLAFQVLWKCSFWVHRNDAVQVFYLTQTRDGFPGKFVKGVRFLAVLLEYIFYNVQWGKVCKIREKLYCAGVVLKIYSDHKFQWPQESLNQLRISCIQSSYLTH